jgi:hypothetical protein
MVDLSALIRRLWKITILPANYNRLGIILLVASAANRAKWSPHVCNTRITENAEALLEHEL